MLTIFKGSPRAKNKSPESDHLCLIVLAPSTENLEGEDEGGASAHVHRWNNVNSRLVAKRP